MKLLRIDIAPSARIQWASPSAREAWEPAVRTAARAYYTLETETVRHRLRRCTTRHVAPDRMGEELGELARRGLLFLPIQRVGSYSGFAHYHPPVVEGRPWSWYGVVAARPDDAAAFAAASATGDHDTIGELLGYPKCCREFFSTVWRAGFVDPIWQQAGAYADPAAKTARIPPERWQLAEHLRYVGVRLAPHLPCSFDCNASLEIAGQWLALARSLGLDGINAAERLLRLPYEWSCLKGIAIVTTEHFRIVTNSTPCYPEYRVRGGG